ncbi:UNVERIFIED_CONTAM: hypothetical protein HDU68_009071 [Siphonaria sp. JEL0065]|nr:hypothetical protein HDU68_009071 [Siphonaria sp. JEL0065]
MTTQQQHNQQHPLNAADAPTIDFILHDSSFTFGNSLVGQAFSNLEFDIGVDSLSSHPPLGSSISDISELMFTPFQGFPQISFATQQVHQQFPLIAFDQEYTQAPQTSFDDLLFQSPQLQEIAPPTDEFLNYMFPSSIPSSTQSSPLLVCRSIPTPAASPKQSLSQINPLLAPKRFSNLKSLENEPGLEILADFQNCEKALYRRRSSFQGRFTRFKPTEAESDVLCAIFQKNPFPSVYFRQTLAEKMGLDIKQVQFWFQNRRATFKSQGIHVLKIKKGEEEQEVEVEISKRKVSLTPLIGESPFFFVEKSSGAA